MEGATVTWRIQGFPRRHGLSVDREIPYTIWYSSQSLAQCDQSHSHRDLAELVLGFRGLVPALTGARDQDISLSLFLLFVFLMPLNSHWLPLKDLMRIKNLFLS